MLLKARAISTFPDTHSTPSALLLQGLRQETVWVLDWAKGWGQGRMQAKLRWRYSDQNKQRPQRSSTLIFSCAEWTREVIRFTRDCTAFVFLTKITEHLLCARNGASNVYTLILMTTPLGRYSILKMRYPRFKNLRHSKLNPLCSIVSLLEHQNT